MAYKNIKLTKQNAVATLTINRPQALNALNMVTIRELTEAVTTLEQDQNIHVVILTGEGKAFIAGADIKEMKNMSVLEAKQFATTGHHLLQQIEHSKNIYIAMINGYALGGGCETLMACDITIAAKSAKLGQPEINLGISPGFGGTQRLPRLVGRNKAKELLLTGDNLTAEQAYQLGLINQVIDDTELTAYTQKLAEKIAAKSPIQTQFIKELVNTGYNLDLPSACQLEISYFSSGFSTTDQTEGMNAFLEKRKPRFSGK